MKIVFQLNGNIEKNIIATAVCKAIKTAFPNDELLVIANYPEIFFCNPAVYKVFHPNELVYFYKDYIEGGEVKFFLQDPYLETDFILENGHIIPIWCRMLGLNYNGELPQLFITNRELNYFHNQFSLPKPLFVIQTNCEPEGQVRNIWTKDIPISIAQKIVDTFSGDYSVVHIRRNDQPVLRDVISVDFNIRQLTALILLSKKRLFMNSFCQHIAAGLNMPAIVCWIINSSQQLGYNMHANIVANVPISISEQKHIIFNSRTLGQDSSESPYKNEADIFNLNGLIAALRVG